MSEDSGTTWSTTTDILDTEAFCRHPPLATSDGWLLPIYRSLPDGNQFGHDYSQALHLDSHPKYLHWVVIPRSVGRVHGSLASSADKSCLIQFFRSRLADRLYRSVGNTDGTSWTEPMLTSLPNNNSSFQALGLSCGRLAIVFNRFAPLSEHPMLWGDARWPSTRWPLTMAFSEDDGETWPFIRDIHFSSGFTEDSNWHLNQRLEYPSIVEGPERVLHV